MPALFTQRDRQIHSLRSEISRVEAWMHADRHDRRAVAWHRQKLRDLKDELSRLEETE